MTTIPVDVGQYDVTVTAVVDPDNVLGECNDGNNAALVDVLCRPTAF